MSYEQRQQLLQLLAIILTAAALVALHMLIC